MIRNIAHRGFSGRYPENTLLAFQKALDAGADGMELDVHLSCDGVPVIIHDETLERTTNGSGLVGEHTCKQLSKLNAAKGHVSTVGREPVPTLEEYFHLIDGKDILTDIELKTSIYWYEGLEQETLSLIERFGRENRVVISSSNHHSILKMQDMAPHLQYGFILEGRIIHPWDYLNRHGIRCHIPLHNSVTGEEMQALRRAGLAVYAWTVNDAADMKTMLDREVNGVITDFPDIFQKLRSERTAARQSCLAGGR